MTDEEQSTNLQRGVPIQSLDDPRMQELERILQQMQAESVIGTRDEIQAAYAAAGIQIDRETLQNRLKRYRALSHGKLRLRTKRGPYIFNGEAERK